MREINWDMATSSQRKDGYLILQVYNITNYIMDNK